MRGVRRALVAACWATLVLATRSAQAQKVLLLRPAKADAIVREAFTRLRAELALQDFEVVVFELDEAQPSPEDLADAARVAGAFAGIALSRRVGTAAANISIADRVTGKSSQRRLALKEGPDAPSILAVRAVDLLRASLRELSAEQPPPTDIEDVDPTPVAAVVTRWAEPEPSRFQLRAGALAFGGATRVGFAFGPTAGFSYDGFAPLRIGLNVAGPLIGARLRTALGSAELRQELGLVSVSWSLLRGARLALLAGLSAGAYHLSARGYEIEAPWAGRSSSVWAFLWGPTLDVELALGRHTLLSLGAGAHLSTPRAAVAVRDDRYVFPWPSTSIHLGFGVEF